MLSYVLKIRIKTALTVITCIGFITILIYTIWTFPNFDDKTSNYPIIIWWTPFQLELSKIINCGNKFKCVLTKDRNFQNNSNLAAYLFYGSNFQIDDLPLPKTNTPWAIFHEESPKNLAFFLYPQGQNLFRITSTFSRESSFPIPLQYLRYLKLLTDTTYYVPVAQKNKNLKTLSPVLYIQSDCDTPIERDAMVKELMLHIDVDSYGACLNNKALSEKYSIDKVYEDLYDPNFMNFVAQYKFIIAIENAICNDYITEKLWRPLIAGSIPIYLGSPTIEDWLPNNKSAVLIKNYQNMSDLAQYIHKLNENDDLYKEYMEHKLKRDGSIKNDLLKTTLQQGEYGVPYSQDFPISAFSCFVCESVYKKAYRVTNKNIYNCSIPTSRDPNNPNWWKSHWDLGKCEAKALDYFLNVLNLHHFSEEMFREQYEKYLNEYDC